MVKMTFKSPYLWYIEGSAIIVPSDEVEAFLRGTAIEELVTVAGVLLAAVVNEDEGWALLFVLLRTVFNVWGCAEGEQVRRAPEFDASFLPNVTKPLEPDITLAMLPA